MKTLAVVMTLSSASVLAGTIDLTVKDCGKRPDAPVIGQLERASATPLNVRASRATFPLQEVAADIDGRLTVRVDEPGSYWLWIHAPNCRSEAIPIFLRDTDTIISGSLQIAASDLPPRGEVPFIHLVGVDPARIAMKVGADGVWRSELESFEPLEYFVEYIGHTFSATLPNPSEKHTRNSGHGFRSIATPENGRIQIAYDPGDLPRSGTRKGAIARFKDDVHGRLFDLAVQYRSNQEHLIEFGKTHGPDETEALRLSRAREFLPQFYSSELPLEVRHAAGIFAVTTSWQLAPEDKAAIRSEVGPSCPLWAFKPLAQYGALTTLFGPVDEMETYLREMSVRSPDRATRANARFYFAQKSSGLGNNEESAQLNRSILGEFGDLEEVARLFRGPGGERLGPGSSFPQKVFENLDGASVQIGRASGFTLLVFSTTWCRPCKELVPDLARVRASFTDNELQMMTVTVGTDPAALRRVLEHQPAQRWHHVATPESRDVVERFDLMHFPRIFLVGPDEIVIATDRQLHQRALVETLRRIIKPDEADHVEPR